MEAFFLEKGYLQTARPSVLSGPETGYPAKPEQSFVNHGIKIFQGLPSLQTLMCFFRIARALDNPCIVIQSSLAMTWTPKDTLAIDPGVAVPDDAIQFYERISDFRT